MWGDFSIREKILLALLVLPLGGVWRKAAGGWVSTIIPAGRQNKSATPGAGSRARTDSEMITVHLVGAVKKPWIYHLACRLQGLRTYRAAEAPDDADTDSINSGPPPL